MTDLIQNHPQIKLVTCNTGKYGKWKRIDLANLVARIESMGYLLSPTGSITRTTLAQGVSYDVPWNYTRPHMFKQCHVDHAIKFDSLGYIPPRCLECWKVVVGPRTVSELFKLLELQNSDTHPCKCGIEVRTYTPRLYGGYYYNDTLDLGRECYERVRKQVSEHISPEVPVVLKRGCTEYEMLIGPSPYWNITKEQLKLDEYIEAHLDLPKNTNVLQPEFIKAHTYRYWIEWAFAHGDETYKEFTDGEDLYEKPVLYHEGSADDIKKDLIKARLNKKHGISLAEGDAMLRHLNGVQFNTAAGLGLLADTMGVEAINPLSYGEHIVY
jgi:hypothetical protein